MNSPNIINAELINEELISSVQSGAQQRAQLFNDQMSKEQLNKMLSKLDDSEIKVEQYSNNVERNNQIKLSSDQKHHSQVQIKTNPVEKIQDLKEREQQKIEVQSQCQEAEDQDNDEQEVGYSDKSNRIMKEVEEKQHLSKACLSNENYNYNSKGNLPQIWAQGSLIILFFIKHFLYFLKHKSKTYKFKHFDQKKFNILIDKTTEYNYYRMHQYFTYDAPSLFETIIHKMKRSFIKVITNYISNFIQNISIIEPNSNLKVTWNAIIFLILLTNYLFIPMQITFSQFFVDQQKSMQTHEALNFIIQLIPSWALLADILFNFNTGFFSDGIIIEEHLEIMKHYIKGKFFQDFLAFFPFWICHNMNITNLDLFLYLAWPKLIELLHFFEEILNLPDLYGAIKDLLKLFLTVLLIAHYCGCIFFFVADLEQLEGADFTWKTQFKLDEQDWLTCYVYSLYWAVITMITLGYGDIYPVTVKEKIIVVFITLITCGVFAYCLNCVGMIIQDISKRNAEFKNKIDILQNHLQKRGLSIQLQHKVIKYFEYLNQEKGEDNENCEVMLNQLTSSLKKQVLTEIYLKILNNQEIFFKNFSQEFLNKLASKLKEKRAMPEEVIYEKYSIQRRIYFIMKGKVDLLIPIAQKEYKNSNSQIISSLNEGNIFGQDTFFTGMASQLTAVSLNVVSLVYLNFEDFFEVIKEYPMDFQKFFVLKDSMNMQGTGIKCLICNQFKHSYNSCPFVTFQCNKNQLIYKNNKTENQIRQDFLRRTQKTESPLVYMDILIEDSIQFIIDINYNKPSLDLIDLIERIKNQNSLYEQQQLLNEDQENQNQQIHPVSPTQEQINTAKRNSFRQMSNRSSYQFKDIEFQDQQQLQQQFFSNQQDQKNQIQRKSIQQLTNRSSVQFLESESEQQQQQQLLQQYQNQLDQINIIKRNSIQKLTNRSSQQFLDNEIEQNIQQSSQNINRSQRNLSFIPSNFSISDKPYRINQQDPQSPKITTHLEKDLQYVKQTTGEGLKNQLMSQHSIAIEDIKQKNSDIDDNTSINDKLIKQTIIDYRKTQQQQRRRSILKQIQVNNNIVKNANIIKDETNNSSYANKNQLQQQIDCGSDNKISQNSINKDIQLQQPQLIQQLPQQQPSSSRKIFNDTYSQKSSNTKRKKNQESNNHTFGFNNSTEQVIYFEKAFIWEQYFPKNNIDKVLEKLKKFNRSRKISEKKDDVESLKHKIKLLYSSSRVKKNKSSIFKKNHHYTSGIQQLDNQGSSNIFPFSALDNIRPSLIQPSNEIQSSRANKPEYKTYN